MLWHVRRIGSLQRQLNPLLQHLPLVIRRHRRIRAAIKLCDDAFFDVFPALGSRSAHRLGLVPSAIRFCPMLSAPASRSNLETSLWVTLMFFSFRRYSITWVTTI